MLFGQRKNEWMIDVPPSMLGLRMTKLQWKLPAHWLMDFTKEHDINYIDHVNFIGELW